MSKVRVPTAWVLVELSSWLAGCLLPVPWSSTETASSLVSLLLRVLIPSDQGSPLLTSFNFHHLLKGPSPTQSWGWAFNIGILVQDTIQFIASHFLEKGPEQLGTEAGLIMFNCIATSPKGNLGECSWTWAGTGRREIECGHLHVTIQSNSHDLIFCCLIFFMPWKLSGKCWCVYSVFPSERSAPRKARLSVVCALLCSPPRMLAAWHVIGASFFWVNNHPKLSGIEHCPYILWIWNLEREPRRWVVAWTKLPSLRTTTL